MIELFFMFCIILFCFLVWQSENIAKNNQKLNQVKEEVEKKEEQKKEVIVEKSSLPIFKVQQSVDQDFDDDPPTVVMPKSKNKFN